MREEDKKKGRKDDERKKIEKKGKKNEMKKVGQKRMEISAKKGRKQERYIKRT